MEIRQETNILDITKAYPFLVDALAEYNGAFEKLRNPVLRNTLGRVATLGQAAAMGQVKPLDLLMFVAQEIMRRTGEGVTVIPPEVKNPEKRGLTDDERRARLKEMIRALHDGESIESLKSRFAETVGDITPAEIASLEQALVADGLPETEIKRLCDLHVELFKGALDCHERPSMPEGHPVHTYMAENAQAVELADEILSQIDRMGASVTKNVWAFSDQYIRQAFEELENIRIHYTRKEYQLFPLLEENGIEAPTKVMWEVHDDIRAKIKKTAEEWDRENPGPTAVNLRELCLAVKDMVYKEEHVLFPMALESLTEGQWSRARHGEDEIGYAWVTPGIEWMPGEVSGGAPRGVLAGSEPFIPLDTGRLSPKVLNLMLKTLPIDMTFVDADDKVAYYSDSSHRVFPRSAGIIGRDVRNCHPSKSVHMVEEILAKFKNGDRDSAEFWLQLNGMFIHIRYFAVRDEAGVYLGCLEVSQELSALRALEGERRLLEWS
ncbi:DUF438 domain-containing protein [Desulfovibrio subterraneus]|uniref:DUF438 domain-containing protein n=1 Tax=Desulfovibrio subterraneus TaxID=2718620 RepID=UPI0022B8B3B7|nr:DUF438 domain-containing protein [Desulfovibrio subterraneus]WBF69038.1 DUF438 domain-containing protein [Desulfovibrio subterraneus]